MKRFQLFSLASAMLLASAAGFTSCSSDSEDPLDGGSGVAGQVVKTQFYLNIPYAGNDEGGNARVSTRMTADNTQKNNNFLGLVEMEMFTFEGEPGTTTRKSTRTIRIGDKPGTSDNNTKRRLYSDIAIPVGTTHMVLYTRASKKSNSITSKSNFEAGSLTNPYANFTDEAKPTLSDFKFNLETIHSAKDFAEQGARVLNTLNTIARTKVTTKDGTSIEWAKIDDATNTGTLEERNILKTLYKDFVSLSAGSENSVIRAINDLKAAVNTQKLVNFKQLTDAIENNCTTAGLSSSNRFPRNIGLPDGAAVLTFDHETKTFTYKEVNVEVPTGRDLVDHTKITYPSELAYFVSSAVRTSATNNNKLEDLPKYDEWLKKSTDWSQYKDVVKSNTTLVVLKEPVQYGVACLESKISCKEATLADNASGILKSTTADNILTVPEEGIKVTGILIGGQPQGVEWNFEPASSATFDHTIYDREMNYGIAAKKSVTAPNYTLVLDNKNSSTADPKQSMVYVTVELENNMGDFYGAEGLIPKDSRFYLVGQLDPNASTATKPSGETIDHVFVKDHTTVANFKITNLKKAYNHIPDLRTSKINVGLAVDLTWQKGITFDVEL
ncbi:hypothetical protein KSW92_08790 [Prevotella copri]|uniref:hypothetical protein n=1 Tax=Segatella copri TaxID=165179 RepID=UPI001C395202|nr:hypothetical protein [Segatella copri]MBV3429623.1 hypothetical protein [Segatella copri]